MLEFDAVIAKLDPAYIAIHNAELTAKHAELSADVERAHHAFVHALSRLARQVPVR